MARKKRRKSGKSKQIVIIAGKHKRRKSRKAPSRKQLAARAAFIRMVRGKHHKKKTSHKRRRVATPKQEINILTKGYGMAGRKRRRHHSKRRHVSHYGFEGRKHRRRHRRYYGGSGKAGKPMDMIMQTALTVGGGFIGSMAARFIPVPPKFKAFVPLAAGVGLTMTPLARKPLIKSLALGMAVIGAISAIKQFVPSVPLLTGDEMTGEYAQIPQSGEAQEMLQSGEYEGDLEGFGAPAVAGDMEGEYMGAPAVAGDNIDGEIDG